MYLWHLLRRNEEELIKKVYQTQKVKTTNGDWFQMIQCEKEKYNIKLTDDEISALSRNKFKSLVEKNVNLVALKFLMEKAASHSKSSQILQEIKPMKTMKTT